MPRGVRLRATQLPGYGGFNAPGLIQFDPSTGEAVRRVFETYGLTVFGLRFPFINGKTNTVTVNSSTTLSLTLGRYEAHTLDLAAGVTLTMPQAVSLICVDTLRGDATSIITADGLGAPGGSGGSGGSPGSSALGQRPGQAGGVANPGAAGDRGATNLGDVPQFYRGLATGGASGGSGAGGGSPFAGDAGGSGRAGAAGGRTGGIPALAGPNGGAAGAAAAGDVGGSGSAGGAGAQAFDMALLLPAIEMMLSHRGGAGGAGGGGGGGGAGGTGVSTGGAGGAGGAGGNGGGIIVVVCDTLDFPGTIRARGEQGAAGTNGTAAATGNSQCGGGGAGAPGGGGGGGLIIVLANRVVQAPTLEVTGGAGRSGATGGNGATGGTPGKAGGASGGSGAGGDGVALLFVSGAA